MGGIRGDLVKRKKKKVSVYSREGFSNKGDNLRDST